MNRNTFGGLMAVVGVAAATGILVTGCGATSAHSDTPGPPVNTSPKNGNQVNLGHGEDQGMNVTWKWCDGTTLVYESKMYNAGGIAVIPNSPECK